MIRRRTLMAASVATLAAPAIVRAQTVKELTFYFPIAVGGPLTAVIDGYCQTFKKQSGITVNAVYAGDYSNTLIKATTAIKGGAGPQFAVLLAAEVHSLQDQDILVSLDDIGLDADGKKWVEGFYPAFMMNSHADGKTWSVPFQRSTAVQFYNKQKFQEAGLDPEKYPRTWAELAAAAEKLTKRDASGRVTQWGFKLASDLGNAQWTFGALANQAHIILMNEAGTETYFNDPRAIEAMDFWHSLPFVHKVTPEGITAWPDLPHDFMEGNTAIIQHTTGSLTNFHATIKFPFGIAGLPGKDGPRTVVGGGNLYFFKAASEAERKAAFQFVRFVTQPELAADWCIHTGYIATSPAAYETAALKKYVADYPPADVARSFLPVAVGELSTYQNQRVYAALTDNIQACLSGKKTPAQAMADTQTEAERLLKPYRHA